MEIKHLTPWGDGLAFVVTQGESSTIGYAASPNELSASIQACLSSLGDVAPATNVAPMIGGPQVTTQQKAQSEVAELYLLDDLRAISTECYGANVMWNGKGYPLRIFLKDCQQELNKYPGGAFAFLSWPKGEMRRCVVKRAAYRGAEQLKFQSPA